MTTNQPAAKGGSRIVLFLTSQAVSLFGSMMVQYAISWHLAFDSGSTWVYALSIVCGLLPQTVISLFSGVWADRYNRKLLIMLSDGGIALSTLALIAILGTGVEGYWPYFLILSIRSVGQGIQSPAVTALIPQITPEHKLMRVNSINGMVQSFVMLLSPIAGAMARQSLPLTNILMIDVITAAIGIGILLMIKIPTHARSTTRVSGFMQELKQGFSYIGSHFFVKRLMIYYIVGSILIVPASAFNVIFMQRAYEPAYMDINTFSMLGDWIQRFFTPDEGYANLFLMANESIFFLGSIFGSIIMASWGGFKNRVTTLVLGCVVFGLSTAAMGFVPAFWLFLLLMLITGLRIAEFLVK
ncbi:MFS transporter [Eubacteriales bacterium OttesenSCG-928-N13]|nr:MFS transporter [Eubacteriales bacterium OttesenSCG-928-N13]